jgi:hypothetical protein
MLEIVIGYLSRLELGEPLLEKVGKLHQALDLAPFFCLFRVSKPLHRIDASIFDELMVKYLSSGDIPSQLPTGG